MLVISNDPQGSEEWLRSRLGHITASNMSKVLAKGQGKTRKAYMYQLASELLTGEVQESYSNAHMEWGNETEGQARAMYELESGHEVYEIGFAHFQDKKIGCSPDGLVGDYGLLEVKCPKTTTQIETYLSGEMPSCHYAQVQGQIWVMGRDWCDFVSFDPRIKGKSSYFCQRIEKDDFFIKTLTDECDRFIDELRELTEILG